MLSFSQRNGITEIKNVIQREYIDEDLHNSLWNAFNIYYLDIATDDYINSNSKAMQNLFRNIWIDFFKEKIDEQPAFISVFRKIIKKFFSNADWYEILNFLEFLPNSFTDSSSLSKKLNFGFIKYCNIQFSKELSAYRFVDGIITEVTSEQSIISIEKALDISIPYKSVHLHLRRSLELFSDKIAPDYRNSIKESISSVEALCAIITGSSNLTLGQALKIIEKDHNIHEALKKAFSNLYGYTSNADGIRHALLDEENLNQEDAQFMLVTCSAFIDYLIQKNISK